VDLATMSSNDLGYFIGPRLNAAGRLDDMSIGIECLLTRDKEHAQAIAGQLDDLNRQRRKIERAMSDRAAVILEELERSDEGSAKAITLFDPDWHAGVVGILAARVRERYQRPTFAFARESDDRLKGSGRSTRAVHLRDVLASIDTRHPGLLLRFGGHAAAAGLTINRADLPTFSSAFNAEVDRSVRGLEPADTLWSDGNLAHDDLTIENAELIRLAGPWGSGFPEPLFDGEFLLLDFRLVGDGHLKMKLQHSDGGSPVDAIRFGPRDFELAGISDRGHFAYRLQVNAFRGVRGVQLVVEQVRWL
jgi:single-stranded-DNA-specific exonuclease